MNPFGPKSDPGETVLLRSATPWDSDASFFPAAAASAVLLHALGRNPDPSAGAAAGAFLLVLVALAFYYAAGTAIRQIAMPGWMITDRRVVSWGGMLQRQIVAWSRAEINQTRLNGDDLVVCRDGRELWLDLRGIRDNALQAALGPLAPPAGSESGPLNRLLRDGEPLIWRHPPLWKWALPAVICLIFPVLIHSWLEAFSGDGGESSRTASLFIQPMIAFLLLLVVASLGRGAAWSAAVTDRRILLRRLHDTSLYDTIPLEAIKQIEAPHEGSHRVYLHANGQRYEFRPGSLRPAERMYEAIQKVLS